MARVTYGSIITDLKGSIGGITYQSNGNAKIARLRATKRKNNTQSQQSKIISFQQLLPSWQAIDVADKEDWNTFATANTKTNKWGEEKNINGFNWFMAINSYLTTCSRTTREAPPSWLTPLVVPSFTTNILSTSFNLSFASTFDHSDNDLILFSSPLIRSLSVLNRKLMKQTKIIAASTTDDIEFLTEWESVHNTPVPISGNPTNNFILVGLMSVHKTKGINSAFTSDWGEYIP